MGINSGFKGLMGKYERKKLLGKPRNKLEDNIIMNRKEIR